MASTGLNRVDESSPLMSRDAKDMYKGEKEPEQKAEVGLIAEGVPVQYTPVHGASPVPTPVSSQPWSTGLCSCINFSDEWMSTDAEVCCLGTAAPCVLYASNRERLAPEETGQFLSSCCLYFGLYITSKVLLKANWIAPCFTFPSRTQLREKYNLQGNREIWGTSMGCCMPSESEEQRQSEERTCDCMVHYFCHPCALCQEARELRRRSPHPVAARASMAAPAMQVMPAKALM